MEKTSCGNFFFAFSKKFSKKSSKWYRNKKSLLYYVVKKEKASGMGCDEKTRNTLSVSRREVKYLLSLPDRLYLLDALDRLLTPDAYGVMWGAYRLANGAEAYQPKFAATLIVLALISTILMDLIQSNLALSLGMLGSLSIVRFRTNIKDPETLVLFSGQWRSGLPQLPKVILLGS